jgi:hypothetical protein
MLVAAAVITTRFCTRRQSQAATMAVAQDRVTALAVVVQQIFVVTSLWLRTKQFLQVLQR